MDVIQMHHVSFQVISWWNDHTVDSSKYLFSRFILGDPPFRDRHTAA